MKKSTFFASMAIASGLMLGASGLTSAHNGHSHSGLDNPSQLITSDSTSENPSAFILPGEYTSNHPASETAAADSLADENQDKPSNSPLNDHEKNITSGDSMNNNSPSAVTSASSSNDPGPKAVKKSRWQPWKKWEFNWPWSI